MPRTRTALPLLALLLLASRLEASPPSRDALLVTPSWLASHLADPDLVLLHVGEKGEYEARHIPGARPVALADVSVSDRTEKGLVLEMPPPEDLRQRLEALGISDDSRVVVYYGKDWVSPATRIVFTLDTAGLGARTFLLDGGMGAWVKAGNAVTDAAPKPRTGKLSALKLRPLVVDAAYVKAHLGVPGTFVVDGRSAVYYDGVETGETPAGKQRTGHIAGAKSIPFTEVFDDENHLRPPGELSALFSKAGVRPGDTVVGYCHIGQQATAVLFAARSLGYPVLLYDGSFQDWSRRTEFPVENPGGKEAR